ncbi:MAG: DUF2059 domain-containing protein [Gammaproteobacteria bacterium]|nr:MAG: DUF2059 domain-containing protein [Gammaproteobacteria bacterium]
MKCVRWLCLSLFCSLMSLPGWADPERDAAAELLRSINAQVMINDMIQRALAQELQKNPALAPYEQVFKAFYEQYLSYDAIREDLIDLYAEAFTLEEIQQITAFYRTPAGAKAMRLAPELFQKGMQIGQRNVTENVDELQRMIAEEAERLQSLQQ